MSRKKKIKDEDTIQVTLGELIEEEPKKTTKKKSTKSRAKKAKTSKKKETKKPKKTMNEKKIKDMKSEPSTKKSKKKSKKKPKSKKISKKKIKPKESSKDKKEVKAKKKKKSTPKKKKSEKVEKKSSEKVSNGPSLSVLPGIGKKLEERLVAAGYDSVSKISKSRGKTLSRKIDGLSETGAKDLIKAAKELTSKSEKKEARPKKTSKKKEKREEKPKKKKVSPKKKKAKKAVKKPKKEKVIPSDKVPEGQSLSTLPGVGRKLEERLIAAGYDSIVKISRARYTSVAKKVEGISKDGAQDLIKAAKEQIQRSVKIEKGETKTEAVEAKEVPKPKLALTNVPGVGAKLAKRLEVSGYDSVARLSRARAESIAGRVSGLSIERANTIITAAKELIQTMQLQSITGAPKTIPSSVITETKPESTEETLKQVTPTKKTKAKKAKVTKKKKEEPKKRGKAGKKKKPTPPEKKRTKVKRTKSGLPVPTAVEELSVELKKKWRAAERKSREPKEDETDQEQTVEVVSLTADETRDSLVKVAMEVLNEAMLTGRPAFEIPSRSGDNIVWDEIRDLLLLGMRTISRPYHSLGSVVDATRTARVMEIVFQLLKSNLHATKREIFYSDVNLFREQKRSDKIIEDVAAMLKTTRDSIHVVASARGSAMGRVIIRDGGDLIDLTKMGTGGWAITPFLDQVEIVESDAEYILLSEKDAAVMRLAEAKYWNREPCIVLTGKGSGDIATRAFLRTLVKELEIPAFALVDSDPYGHYIYSVFLRGSKRLSYESPFIATPELKLLGVLSRDLDEYKIPKAVRIPMEPADIKRMKDMLKEPFVQSNKPWVEDLQLMLKIKEKAEIQAFASHSFEYLTDEYLPKKLETGDWI